MVGVQVGRFDDERVAVPVPPRVPEPGALVLRQACRLTQLDDAHVVHHLGHDHHVVGVLHDGVVVVVPVVRQHRRPCAGPERHQAALGQRPELGVVGFPEALAAGVEGEDLLTRTPSQRGDAAVGRPGHE